MKWRRIEGLLLKCWWITTQRVDRMFDIFYWPVLDIFIWGLFSNYFASESSFDPLKVILGGIILWLFLWRPFGIVFWSDGDLRNKFALRTIRQCSPRFMNASVVLPPPEA